MNIRTTSAVAATAAAIILAGCSREARDTAIDRVGKAAKELNGEVSPDDVEHDTPNIVREEQRKERIRQNTKWTPENQAKYPIEYCRAQLAELDANSQKLSVGAHKLSVALSAVNRENTDDKANLSNLENFLATAKQAYRDADTANSWPVQIGGFAFSKEKAQQKIVEAARKVQPLRDRIGARVNQIASLQKKLDAINAEQKRLALIRERVQSTMRDLETRKVIEGDSSVADALNAISDSMGALSTSFDDPSVEDMMAPSPASTIQDDFNAIMSE